MWRSVSDFRHNLLLSLIVSSLSFLSFKLYFINGQGVLFIKFKTPCAAEIFWNSTILSLLLYHLLFSSIICTDSRRDSPQCSRLTILGSRSRHRRNILSASWSCWYGFDFPVFDWVFWRVRSTNTTFYTSPLRSKVISFMIDELIKSRNVTCGILISTHLSQQPMWF